MSPEANTLTPRHAVVICTRNRPGDVEHVLNSLAEHGSSRSFLSVVVDASDPDVAERVEQAVQSPNGLQTMYLRYDRSPSLARQRNAGVDALPNEIEFVHFLDDDVTLEPDYIDVLAEILETESEVGGVGGLVLDSNTGTEISIWKRIASRIFLLESSRPGKVLASGGLRGAQSVSLGEPLAVECLGGCASYRRALVEQMRFDDRLEGYSMDEDLDFSYRVGKVAKLIVEPRARLIHHLSSSARHSVRESRRDLLVHRYWFIEKNVDRPFKKVAFWWKIFGSFLMASLSRNPDALEAKKGLIDGIRIVRTRAHPLLSASEPLTRDTETP
jgi:GT2 family glycosyltransferase